jgi:hypothetical protein
VVRATPAARLLHSPSEGFRHAARCSACRPATIPTPVRCREFLPEAAKEQIRATTRRSAGQAARARDRRISSERDDHRSCRQGGGVPDTRIGRPTDRFDDAVVCRIRAQRRTSYKPGARSAGSARSIAGGGGARRPRGRDLAEAGAHDPRLQIRRIARRRCRDSSSGHMQRTPARSRAVSRQPSPAVPVPGRSLPGSRRRRRRRAFW